MATTFTGHEFYSRKILKVLPAQLNFLGTFSTDISGEVLGPAKSVEVPLVEMDAAAALRANGGCPRSILFFPDPFGGIHNAVGDPQWNEARHQVVVDDQQELDVVGHDYGIGKRGTGIDLV